MKTFELKAEARENLGKKAVKALRAEGKIPAVLNGGKIVELPYKEALRPGEKLVEIDAKRGIITTDITVKAEDVRKLIYTPDIFAIEMELNGEKRRPCYDDRSRSHHGVWQIPAPRLPRYNGNSLPLTTRIITNVCHAITCDRQFLF